MIRSPVKWSAGKWDVGSLHNIGMDSIPTLYDASISGFISEEFQSGIGSQNDIILIEIIEDTSGYLYDSGNIPSGNIWVPRIKPGYFYINDEEYYLYADKGVESGIPTSGTLSLGVYDYDSPPNGAPIVVTLGSSEFTTDEPFAKTYEYTPFNSTNRTVNKYRKISDLTGRKEFVNSSGYYDDYSFTYPDMGFTFSSVPSGNQYEWFITCYPSGSSVTVEFETQEDQFYDVDLDLNPYNNNEANNTMLILTNEDNLVPHTIDIVNVYRYLVGENQDVEVIANVKGRYGNNIPDVVVEFDSDNGSFTPSSGTTDINGVIQVMFTSGNSDSEGCTITAECSGIMASGWMQFGELT
jgi:hypothetical protein